MAGSRFKGFVAALVAGSMVIGSTSAVAASSAVPIAVPATQIDPWVALTAMSGGATAAALCGAATVAAAAQTPGGCVLPALDAPPVAQTAPPPQPIPVPPVEGPSGLAFDPLLLALGALAAAALIYFLVRNHHSNSPA
jgi:hypothetical protein